MTTVPCVYESRVYELKYKTGHSNRLLSISKGIYRLIIRQKQNSKSKSDAETKKKHFNFIWLAHGDAAYREFETMRDNWTIVLVHLAHFECEIEERQNQTK